MSPADGEASALIVWTIIISIGLITFVTRFVPIALLSRLELPIWLKRTLTYVPPAVMTAIITPALFFPGGTPTIALDAPRLVAATLAAVVAWRTRSVLWTVILGMGALWGLQVFLP